MAYFSYLPYFPTPLLNTARIDAKALSSLPFYAVDPFINILNRLSALDLNEFTSAKQARDCLSSALPLPAPFFIDSFPYPLLTYPIHDQRFELFENYLCLRDAATSPYLAKVYIAIANFDNVGFQNAISEFLSAIPDLIYNSSTFELKTNLVWGFIPI